MSSYWLGLARVCVVILGVARLPGAALALGEGGSPEMKLGACKFERSYDQNFSNFQVNPWIASKDAWIAHTPWAGDFGDAAFSDPRPGFPFTVAQGTFRIEARKTNGRWRSGLIASADAIGNGFGQRYGYFEVSAKLPRGQGLWPAIWLASIKPKGSKEPSVEIDINEHYGHFPGDFHSVIHVWGPTGVHQSGESHIEKVESGLLYGRFHKYGAEVGPENIVFYFDRSEYWRVKTPSEHKRPLMVLIDLALGSGWPIDQAPSPSFLEVAYVQVWRRVDPSCKM